MQFKTYKKIQALHKEERPIKLNGTVGCTIEYNKALHEDYIIKKGDIELGLLWSDIKEHLLTPTQYDKFTEYMRGQTCGMLGEIHSYVSLVFTGDFERFINNKPNLD